MKQNVKIQTFLESVFDETWYRESVQAKIPIQQSALDHYLKVGLPQRYAPCPALTIHGGRHMVPWLRDQLDHIETAAKTRMPLRDAQHPTTHALLKPETFKNPPNKKLAIYSANFGGYDLIEPINESWTENVDFYCFTDGLSQSAEGWTFVSPNYFNIDPQRTARFYKLHPHLFFSQYEWSLWIDANIALTECPMKIVERYLDGNAQIVTIKHPLRGCIYQEALECALLQKDDSTVMFEQIERYLDSGYPQMNGLVESNVMLRRHGDPQVVDFMRRWWGEIERGSCRDQLSFNYCHSKSPGISLDFFPEPSARNSPRFRLEKHISS